MLALTLPLQLVFECWIGRYPFLQPGQDLRDLDEEEVKSSAAPRSCVAVVATHAGLQVLACIDDENERGVRSLVATDARMGEQMKSFLLRCLDRSPNTRPAAIDLMKDPWLAGADQQVRALPATAFPF
jgi:serine/threonine protein kinase